MTKPLGDAQDAIEASQQIHELGLNTTSLGESEVLYAGAGEQIGLVILAA